MRNMAQFGKVAIFGAGLLGASLAWALKERGCASVVHIWNRGKANRDFCEKQPWCDKVFENIDEAASDADLVVLATTASTIPSILKDIRSFLKSGAIVTDVGSTKLNIVRKCEKILDGLSAVFVGSHPMAGSEKSGASAAKPDLFKGASCFVCPSEKSEVATEKVADMWRRLGMKVFFKSPEEHDKIVARVSHLPQCASSALALLAADNLEDFKLFAGNGFRDTTRIAKSDPAMWESILSENAENISSGLSKYIAKLQELKNAVDNRDCAYIENFLTSARQTRLKLDK